MLELITQLLNYLLLIIMNHLLLVFLIIFIQLYAVEGFLPFRYGGITLRIDKRLIANIKTTTGNDFSKVYNSAIIGGKSTVVTVSASKVDEFGESMRKYDIPNKLTLARIYAIPLFVLAFILHRVRFVSAQFLLFPL